MSSDAPHSSSAADSGWIAQSTSSATASAADAGGAGAGLRVRTVADAAGLDALEPDWERLATLHPGAGTFNGWPWNRLWWRHYGHLGELRTLVVERVAGPGADGSGNRVVAIAPFYHARPRALVVLRPATLRLLGTGGDTSPDDLDMLAEPAEAAAAAEVVAAHLFERSGARRLLLEHVPAGSALLGAVERRWSARRIGRPVRTSEHRWVAALPPTASAWHASLSRNARKHLKRRRRRAETAGRVEHAPVTRAEELDDAFAELVRLHRARRASRGEGGSFASETYRRFHRELMEALLARGELALSRMRLDGRTVGVEYAFRTGDALGFFQTGFDPDAAHLSPGHLMMAHLIERGIESGARVADFLRGDYPYKASYATERRESVTLDGPVRAVPFSPVRIAALRRARLRVPGAAPEAPPSGRDVPD